MTRAQAKQWAVASLVVEKKMDEDEATRIAQRIELGKPTRVASYVKKTYSGARAAGTMPPEISAIRALVRLTGPVAMRRFSAVWQQNPTTSAILAYLEGPEGQQVRADLTGRALEKLQELTASLRAAVPHAALPDFDLRDARRLTPAEVEVLDKKIREGIAVPAVFSRYYRSEMGLVLQVLPKLRTIPIVTKKSLGIPLPKIVHSVMPRPQDYIGKLTEGLNRNQRALLAVMGLIEPADVVSRDVQSKRARRGQPAAVPSVEYRPNARDESAVQSRLDAIHGEGTHLVDGTVRIKLSPADIYVRCGTGDRDSPTSESAFGQVLSVPTNVMNHLVTEEDIEILWMGRDLASRTSRVYRLAKAIMTRDEMARLRGLCRTFDAFRDSTEPILFPALQLGLVLALVADLPAAAAKFSRMARANLSEQERTGAFMPRMSREEFEARYGSAFPTSDLAHPNVAELFGTPGLDDSIRILSRAEIVALLVAAGIEPNPGPPKRAPRPVERPVPAPQNNPAQAWRYGRMCRYSAHTRPGERINWWRPLALEYVANMDPRLQVPRMVQEAIDSRNNAAADMNDDEYDLACRTEQGQRDPEGRLGRRRGRPGPLVTYDATITPEERARQARAIPFGDDSSSSDSSESSEDDDSQSSVSAASTGRAGRAPAPQPAAAPAARPAAAAVPAAGPARPPPADEEDEGEPPAGWYNGGDLVDEYTPDSAATLRALYAPANAVLLDRFEHHRDGSATLEWLCQPNLNPIRSPVGRLAKLWAWIAVIFCQVTWFRITLRRFRAHCCDARDINSAMAGPLENVSLVADCYLEMADACWVWQWLFPSVFGGVYESKSTVDVTLLASVLRPYQMDRDQLKNFYFQAVQRQARTSTGAQSEACRMTAKVACLISWTMQEPTLGNDRGRTVVSCSGPDTRINAGSENSIRPTRRSLSKSDANGNKGGLWLVFFTGCALTFIAMFRQLSSTSTVVIDLLSFAPLLIALGLLFLGLMCAFNAISRPSVVVSCVAMLVVFSLTPTFVSATGLPASTDPSSTNSDSHVLQWELASRLDAIATTPLSLKTKATCDLTSTRGLSTVTATCSRACLGLFSNASMRPSSLSPALLSMCPLTRGLTCLNSASAVVESLQQTFLLSNATTAGCSRRLGKCGWKNFCANCLVALRSSHCGGHVSAPSISASSLESVSRSTKHLCRARCGRVVSMASLTPWCSIIYAYAAGTPIVQASSLSMPVASRTESSRATTAFVPASMSTTASSQVSALSSKLNDTLTTPPPASALCFESIVCNATFCAIRCLPLSSSAALPGSSDTGGLRGSWASSVQRLCHTTMPSAMCRCLDRMLVHSFNALQAALSTLEEWMSTNERVSMRPSRPASSGTSSRTSPTTLESALRSVSDFLSTISIILKNSVDYLVSGLNTWFYRTPVTTSTATTPSSTPLSPRPGCQLEKCRSTPTPPTVERPDASTTVATSPATSSRLTVSGPSQPSATFHTPSTTPAATGLFAGKTWSEIASRSIVSLLVACAVFRILSIVAFMRNLVLIATMLWFGAFTGWMTIRAFFMVMSGPADYRQSLLDVAFDVFFQTAVVVYRMGSFTVSVVMSVLNLYLSFVVPLLS